MNTLQILNTLKKDTCFSQKYFGVYAYDELPKKFKILPAGIILNTHKKNQPGQHWLAIYINENKYAYFFDSFGNHPKYFRLEKYLNSICVKWDYNKKVIQSYYSDFCGVYSLMFLYFMCRNYNLDSFNNLFSSNSLNNDKKLEKYLFNIK